MNAQLTKTMHLITNLICIDTVTEVGSEKWLTLRAGGSPPA